MKIQNNLVFFFTVSFRHIKQYFYNHQIYYSMIKLPFISQNKMCHCEIVIVIQKEQHEQHEQQKINF